MSNEQSRCAPVRLYCFLKVFTHTHSTLSNNTACQESSLFSRGAALATSTLNINHLRHDCARAAFRRVPYSTLSQPCVAISKYLKSHHSATAISHTSPSVDTPSTYRYIPGNVSTSSHSLVPARGYYPEDTPEPPVFEQMGETVAGPLIIMGV